MNALPRLQLGLVAVSLFAAEQAGACPSCVDPRAATTSAMLVSTAALSLIPLIFILSVARWVVLASRAERSDG